MRVAPSSALPSSESVRVAGSRGWGPRARVGGAVLITWCVVSVALVFFRNGRRLPFEDRGDWSPRSLFFMPVSGGGEIWRHVFDAQLPSSMVKAASILLTAAIGMVAVTAMRGADETSLTSAGRLVAFAAPVWILVTLGIPDYDWWSPKTLLRTLVAPLLLPLLGAVLVLMGSKADSTPSLPRSAGARRVQTTPSSGGGQMFLGPAPLGTRIGSYVLELLLAIITLGIGWLIWSIVLWSEGLSPAKKMMGLVVIDRRTGRPATGGTMAFRELVGKGVLGAMTCGITGIVSIFMVLGGGERRAVHDSIASTIVSSARQTVPPAQAWSR